MSPFALEALVATLPIGILVLDETGTVLIANDESARLLGTERATLTGRVLFTELARLPGMSAAHETYRARIGTGLFEHSVRTVVGALEVDLRFRSFHDDGGRRAVVAIEPAAGAVLLEVVSKVKHDVNNLLMGLLGHTALLAERPDLPEAARKKVQLIEEQGRRIRDRIADLDVLRRVPGGGHGSSRRAD